MKIFYVDIDEFKMKIGKDELKNYADKEFNTEKRFYEYTIGRYLVKNVAKDMFGIANPEIVINEKGKPYLENEDLHFSISHSNNILMACFDKCPCGIDLEEMKDRNIERFSEYYGEEFEDKFDFYKYWTLKEASYKLGCEIQCKYSSKFLNNYYLTIVSSGMFEKDINIQKYSS